MPQIKEITKEEFPEKLRQIPDPPKKLWVLGNTPHWQNYKFLCVVGARRFSQYGKDVCEKFIAGLAGHPIVIVSGLALGIDGLAHRAALRADLTTIAVPGSGLSPEALYPRVHVNMANEIVCAGGCILSEFPSDMHAAPYMFPKRNRIMAGLCDAVLIIECERKSGTLITAKLALDYNRDVGVVPGSVFSQNSEGPHLLLGLGAAPIASSEDILKLLGIHVPEAAHAAHSEEKYKDCTENEKKIIELLHEPLTKDIIIESLTAPPATMAISDVQMTLSVLEIKGLIKESLGEIHLT